MASPLPQTDGSRHAPLHTNRFMTGLWTNRNPLRDAATPYLYEKFYSATHYDSLIGGLNAELSPKMTMKRRGGHTVYNSQTFPAINRFYGFRTFSASTEDIRVMADTAAAIYDATGPDTKVNIWNKSAGAGATTFQSVGNIMYFGDGVDQKKWVQTTTDWEPLTEYDAGTLIVDTNQNLQVVVPQATATIVSVQVTVAGGVSTLILGLAGPNPFQPGIQITFAGATTATWLNGTTSTVTGSGGSNQVTATTTHGAYAQATDTGTATSTNAASGGVSGATVTWATTLGAITRDGTLAWLNKGPSIQNWGIDAPTSAPTCSQAALPTSYPSWAASTTYFPDQVILGAVYFQKLITAGITGATEPTWSTTIGGHTTDGTAVWECVCPQAWIASTAVTAGQFVAVNFDYYISPGVVVYASDFFICTSAGTTGASQPTWIDGTGSTLIDGSVIWTNIGASLEWTPLTGGGPPNGVGPTQTVSLAQTIVDPNGYLQTIYLAGETGTIAPAWQTGLGNKTTDGTAIWINVGPFGVAFTQPSIYAYAYTSSTTSHTGTASPESEPITRGVDERINVQGVGSDDPQVDTITIYRTAQGGSTLLYLDQIPNPGGGMTWTYADVLLDSALEVELPAAIAEGNNPPPAGFLPMAYHESRIWGFVNNELVWSNGTNQTGDPNQSFDPFNFFVYPAKGVRAWACSLGLIVYTVSEVYIVSGTGSDADPFTTQKYIDGLGILSYDAFTVNKTTPYVMTSIKQVMAMDPSSGLIEPGFPIADQFDALFDPNTVQMAWHEGAHGDTALYVADGVDSWFRMAALSAPESGLVWSSQATIAAGFKAMASIETSPGQRNLLLGPSTSGPILQRDETVNTDNGVTFPWYPIIGSIVLAQPGQVAEIAFFTLESVRTGSRPTVGVLLGEIGGQNGLGFETLVHSRQDPVNLPPSNTLFSDRYYMMQNQNTVICRHLQIRIDFPAEDAANELLTYTIFGALQNTKDTR